MDIKHHLKTLVAGRALSAEDTFELFEAFLGEGKISDAQIGAVFCGMAFRPVTSDELTGAARSLREHMLQVDFSKELPGVEFLDTCGTGGSGRDTFNTSTASAFVVAASGQHVAKHGNRAATSRCGSADLLKALGVNIDAEVSTIIECMKKTDLGFFFAPHHHPATKRVVGIRRELGFRTIFNFLGPLSNPAGAVYQVLGVSAPEMVPVVADALRRLGTKRALVVCGEDGLDELTLTGVSVVSEVNAGEVETYNIRPEEVDLKPVRFEYIQGMEPEDAAKKVRDIFSGEKSSYRDLVCLNAGAALYVCGKAKTIRDGVHEAGEIIDSGAALATLEHVVKVTHS